MARPTGDAMPVLWDGERLRLASAVEAIDGKKSAAGAHICFEHWDEPDVLRFGPLDHWYPLTGLNRAAEAMLRRR